MQEVYQVWLSLPHWGPDTHYMLGRLQFLAELHIFVCQYSNIESDNSKVFKQWPRNNVKQNKIVNGQNTDG